MKTLSTIILEESIRLSLNEIVVDPDAIPKPKPKPDPKPDPTDTTKVQNTNNKKLANSIATAIINSTSWYNDREEDLVAAFKAIPNMQTFYEVNKIVSQKEKLALSSFIGNFIAKNESNVWIPILKHLIDIKAPIDIFKKYYKKTKFSYVASNKTISKYVSTNNIGTGEGVTVDDGNPVKDFLLGNIEFIVLSVVAIAACGYASGKIPNFSCGKAIMAPLRIPYKTIQTARSGAEVAEVTSKYFKQVDKIFSGTGRYNRRNLIAAIKIAVEKGDISKEKAEIAIKLLNDGKNINKILQIAKFQSALDAWVQTGKATKGDALAIANLLPANLREKWLPLLQQEENRLIGKTSTVTDIEKELPIVARSVKNFLTSKVKLQSDTFKRWEKIYNKAFPETSSQFQGTLFSNYIEKVIYLIKERNFTVDRAIASAERDLTFGQLSKKRSDLNYFIKNYDNLRNFPFYLRLEKFPSFKQWKADMERVNFNKITEEEYRLQRWLWQNQKS